MQEILLEKLQPIIEQGQAAYFEPILGHDGTCSYTHSNIATFLSFNNISTILLWGNLPNLITIKSCFTAYISKILSMHLIVIRESR